VACYYDFPRALSFPSVTHLSVNPDILTHRPADRELLLDHHVRLTEPCTPFYSIFLIIVVVRSSSRTAEPGNAHLSKSTLVAPDNIAQLRRQFPPTLQSPGTRVPFHLWQAVYPFLENVYATEKNRYLPGYWGSGPEESSGA